MDMDGNEVITTQVVDNAVDTFNADDLYKYFDDNIYLGKVIKYVRTETSST